MLVLRNKLHFLAAFISVNFTNQYKIEFNTTVQHRFNIIKVISDYPSQHRE